MWKKKEEKKSTPPIKCDPFPLMRADPGSAQMVQKGSKERFEAYGGLEREIGKRRAGWVRIVYRLFLFHEKGPSVRDPRYVS